MRMMIFNVNTANLLDLICANEYLFLSSFQSSLFSPNHLRASQIEEVEREKMNVKSDK